MDRVNKRELHIEALTKFGVFPSLICTRMTVKALEPTLAYNAHSHSLARPTTYRARPTLRRFPPTLIPDLPSLPIVAPTSAGLICRTTAPGGLFADLATPSEALLALSSEIGDMNLSPIQSFRVKMSNFQPSFTLDDFFELFSSMGSVHLCNLIRTGLAEVVNNKAPDARESVRRYHGRELDKKPMHVQLMTPIPDRMEGTAAPNTMRFASLLGPSVGTGPYKSDVPLSQSRKYGQYATSGTSEVDVSVIGKAFFNVATDSGPRRPVGFTVSLRQLLDVGFAVVSAFTTQYLYCQQFPSHSQLYKHTSNILRIQVSTPITIYQ
ncbi:putative rna and export factor binding protein [Fasciolopsis buskii]|uniref:Putative rna and export factor binding protein n=1 Tax=Fasciolopsis buskii TaxID=27845 RepID=A0A8E0VLT4_9TREM|nr:putative rna and export factor binding protein [Fasciolopsis buski]